MKRITEKGEALLRAVDSPKFLTPQRIYQEVHGRLPHSAPALASVMAQLNKRVNDKEGPEPMVEREPGKDSRYNYRLTDYGRWCLGMIDAGWIKEGEEWLYEDDNNKFTLGNFASEGFFKRGIVPSPESFIDEEDK